MREFIAFLAGAATLYLATSAYIMAHATYSVQPGMPWLVKAKFAVVFALVTPWICIRHYCGPQR